jgi:hypothetical protein
VFVWLIAMHLVVKKISIGASLGVCNSMCARCSFIRNHLESLMHRSKTRSLTAMVSEGASIEQATSTLLRFIFHLPSFAFSLLHASHCGLVSFTEAFWLVDADGLLTTTYSFKHHQCEINGGGGGGGGRGVVCAIFICATSDVTSFSRQTMAAAQARLARDDAAASEGPDETTLSSFAERFVFVSLFVCCFYVESIYFCF